jgi:DNA-binding transcriptional LysR family regulator
VAFDLRFTLHKLSVFCKVVEAGGVGRAAEQLYVAQPVVTAHVQSLEQRLGAKLFERDGRQTRLTPAGEAVYQWARETLTRARDLERELSGLSDGTAGSAVIAASMSLGSYLLPPILSEFHRDRPHASVSLTVLDPEHALEATATGAADFAVIVTDELPPPGRFDAALLGREELVVVLAPDYPLAGARVSVERARTLPFVSSPRDHLRRAIVDAELRRAGLDEIDVVIELGHPEAMKRAVRDGLGAAVLFRSAVREELETGLLRKITIAGTQLSVPIQLVRRKGKRMSLLQAQLVEFVRERVEGELSRARGRVTRRSAAGSRSSSGRSAPASRRARAAAGSG